jgi:2-C-methyl-D-erythritol 4-phosphate cytidylyltransferase
MNAAIIAAGGKGSRFGAATSKQFALLGGRPLVEWSLAAFENEPLVERVILAYPTDEPESRYSELIRARGFRKILLTQGGEARLDSVRNGFAALGGLADNDVVLIHDAARPLVSRDLIRNVLQLAAEHGAAVPVLALTETVKEVKDGAVVRTVPRENLAGAQTPQGFRYGVLREAYRKLDARGAERAHITDEALLVEWAGFAVTVVPGERRNLKITHPEDLALAAALANPGDSL